MKEKEKKNIIPGTIVISFVAAIIVFCIMLNVEKNALSAYEKGSVWTSISDMEKGISISEENVEQYFVKTWMDKSLIPESAITEKEVLAGSQVVSRIDKGTVITASMLSKVREAVSDIEKPVVAGFKAEDLYQVVSGVLRSGDRIHIYVVDEELEAAYLIWENVVVQEVFDSSGNQILPGDEITAASRVNIFMDQESVGRFYSELAAGSLRVVKLWNENE